MRRRCPELNSILRDVKSGREVNRIGKIIEIYYLMTFSKRGGKDEEGMGWV